MKRFLSGAAVAALLALPGAVEAQLTIGPTVAFGDDVDAGVGATVGAQMSNIGPEWGLLADFLIFFPEGFDYFEVNGNLTYDIPIEDSSVVPFILGGLNIARLSVSAFGVSGSTTEVGLNLGGGIDFDLGNFRPTAGVRAEVSGGEQIVFFLTLPFQTGGDN